MRAPRVTSRTTDRGQTGTCSHRLLPLRATCLFLPLLFLTSSFSAFAQAAPKETSSTILDTVTRWLTVVGEKTEDLIAPRFARVGDAGKSVWAGLVSGNREFEESYPVRPDCVVSITRTVGEGMVRVSTWDNPVVRVRVSGVVGAEQQETAQQIADAIRIGVSQQADRMEITTEAPDIRDRGKVAIKLDYEITIPAGASVTCKNDWGDTEIIDVGGAVTVDSRFGALDLRTIGGPVRVRAWGEFPLRALGLRQGGTFEMQGTQSEFANVSGNLKITNFMGAVAVRELPAEIALDVTSESGPIDLHIPENATPDISASAAFGAIKSDIPLDQSVRGDLVIARGGKIESPQHLSLHASFDTITIHQEGVKPPEKAPERNGGEFVRRNIEQSLEVPANAEIAINAIAGDVRITAVDTNQLSVKAVQVVQMQTNANAQAAIEALNVRSEVVDGRVMVLTSVRDNMAALGCTHYRIDLEVLCPRNSVVKLSADSGFSTIAGLGAALTIEQSKGSVSIEQCKGEAGALDVTLQEGDVTVKDCVGPLNATTQQGSITTASIAGKQVITASQGRVEVESPKGELVLRNRGGDARVLALEGVFGSYNVGVEKGNITVLLPPDADATLFVTAVNGQVQSRVRMSGSVERERREYTATLGAGQHRVDLAVDSGNIFID
ncbi:MAG: DUF4097 family beta strand repeat-containing protein [Candidatus Hydrogenedentes bacterium]|nr:DUF4097 family beta strand repeat-containing protein [Candidatus Hydrogenedentota bacterium]